MNIRIPQTLLPALLALLTAHAGADPSLYIRPDAPPAPIPALKGERYEALVPDTLDLAEQARLALRWLSGPTDPNDDYRLYWLADLHNNPPVMKKDTYLNIGGKYMEATPLLRLMSGSASDSDIERAMADGVMRRVGADGLLYQRRGEQPGQPPQPEGQWQSLAGCGSSRLMNMMAAYDAIEPNPVWSGTLKTMIDRYDRLATDKGEWAFFAQDNYMLNQDTPGADRAPTPGYYGVDSINGRLLQPLAHYYAATKYELAKRLGRRLVNYLRHQSEYFGPNGEWLVDRLDEKQYPGRGGDTHFHGHTLALQSMLEFGIATEDRELIDFVRASFVWAVRRNSTIEGQSETATRIGFFLEYLNPHYPTAEICEVADMIALAIKLSRAGAGDYWDDADRWTRNHFIANQMTSADWTEENQAPSFRYQPAADETIEGVARRNVGMFFSWTSGNDGCPRNPRNSIGMMHCCGGNAFRAMYYVWESILEEKDGVLKVNLLLNRASPWADVDSYIPYTGRVEIKVKRPLKQVSIRMPEWVGEGSGNVAVTLDGQPREAVREGRYLNVGPVEPGKTVAVGFPITETKIDRRIYGEPHETMIGNVEYDSIIFRGSTVVRIAPPGTNYPLYMREHYRTDQPRFVKVQRFVAANAIAW